MSTKAEMKEQLEQAVSEASKTLQSFPKGKMGLTPAAVKVSPEYQAAKANYQKAFAKLRAFNSRRNDREAGRKREAA